MDYVVGSVAALISGNVTPNRPKKLKKAATPMKHQPSPNVTPKSEFVEDRSIFLSPTMQKKKAIVKKSPKRIFQNPDLDVTKEDEGDATLTSPKADKVKKHLKEELDANSSVDQIMLSPKSPNKTQDKNIQSPSSKKKIKITNEENNANMNESPSKKKKKRKSVADEEKLVIDENAVKENEKENLTTNIETTQNIISKKKSKKSKFVSAVEVEKEPDTNKISTKDNNININESPSKNKKKRKSAPEAENANEENIKENLTTNIETTQNVSPKKKSKKSKIVPKAELEKSDSNITNQEQQKNKKKKNKLRKNTPVENTEHKTIETQSKNPKKKEKKKKNNQQIPDDNDKPETITINSNAVTNEDTDSEHESDDEIESENEVINKKAFETAPAESSDEEEEKPKEKVATKEVVNVTEDEVKRTLFVGNVPFSNKCKKEIKKIFSQYGQIDTVRIRTIPVKDARVTPKMAVIKNELHPDRNTVNVYVKYVDAGSVDKALAGNNTVLNGNHLRVSRSETTGAEHDPRLSVFVGNMPFALEDEALRAKFEKCGEIVSVRIIRDKKTNAGKGFGYINFASKDGVELALALTEEDLTIKNRIMRVKRCTPPTQRKTFKPDRRIQGRPGQQFGKGRFPDKQNDRTDGAYRRVINKRKHQESNDGPPNKRQNLNQPHKEKKVRKEFVGMTAEKKKKHKFNKGQKKKKVLSEILTKK